ncbi:MAG: hypothetical protein FJ087_06200 [Deltaproteobacteria bacterium]|nr:hypothetical protein [Deltaproteobacteria bacterium]
MRPACVRLLGRMASVVGIAVLCIACTSGSKTRGVPGADAGADPDVPDVVESGDAGAGDGDGTSDEVPDIPSEPACPPKPLPDGLCSEDGWCWMSPLPQGQNLSAVWCSSPGDCWAAGLGGALLHWDGEQWSQTQLLTPKALSGLWGAARDDVWAVGPLSGPTNDVPCTILHWDGGGWAPSPGLDLKDLSLMAVHGSAPDSVWAVGGDFGVETTDRGVVLRWDGHRWSLDLAQAPGWLRTVWAAGTEDVWVGGEWGGVGHRGPAGWSWMPIGTDRWVSSIWGAAPNDIWFVEWAGFQDVFDEFGIPIPGVESPLLHWDGTSLSRIPFPAVPDLACLHEFSGFSGFGDGSELGGTGPNDVWLVGLLGTWHWNGEAWTASCGLGRDGWLGASDLHAAAPDHVTIVGLRGYQARWDGACWERHGGLAPVGGHLRTTWSAGPDDTWVVTGTRIAGAWSPVFHHWNGSKWSERYVERTREQADPLDVVSMWGSGPADIWAVGFDAPWYVNCYSWAPDGERGRVLHWDGTSWTEQDVRLVPPLCAVSGTGPTDVWAGGLGGAVAHWDGEAWSVESGVPVGFIRSIWVARNGDVWAVGDDRESGGYGVVARREGGVWRSPLASDERLMGVWGSGPTDVWVIGESHVLHWDGHGWSVAVTGPGSRNLYGIWGFGPEDVWLLGMKWHDGVLGTGQILHWDGSYWKRERLGVGAYGSEGPYAIGGARPGYLWTLVEGGVLRRKM